MKKKILALVMALVMTLSLLPVTAMAADTEYTITLLVDGAQYQTITLNAGESTQGKIPVETDKFYFGGWSPAIPDVMPAENIETEALLIFKRGFRANGGTFTAPEYENQNMVTVMGKRTPNSSNKIDQHVEVPQVVKEGYTFLGWWNYPYNPTMPKPSIKPGQTSDYVSFAKSGTSMIARWSANTYTVKFNANGGDGTMADQAFVYDTSDTLSLNAFTRTDYTFVGWSTTADGAVQYADGEAVQNVKELTADDDGVVELYAVWERTKYTITFMVNGEKYHEITLPVGDPIAKDEIPVESDKFYFDAWTPAIPDIMPSNDIVTNAKLSYKRHFKANGGTFTAPEYQNQDMVTVKGKWTPLSEQERVQYVAVPEVVREGYTFLGWWRDPYNPDHRNPAIKPNQTDDYVSLEKSGTAMLARWRLNEYTVTFHSNNGKNETVTQDFTYTEAENLTKNSFTKEVALINGDTMTHTFLGWATEPDGAVVYTDEEEVTNLTMIDGDNIDLYAVWTPDTVEVGPAQSAIYMVEHYVQDAKGNYQLVETERLSAELGATVKADSAKYDDQTHHVNTTHSLLEGVVSFDLTAQNPVDTILTLKVYYDVTPASSNPQTGDTGILMHMGLLAFSAIAAAALLFYATGASTLRKKKEDESA